MTRNTYTALYTNEKHKKYLELWRNNANGLYCTKRFEHELVKKEKNYKKKISTTFFLQVIPKIGNYTFSVSFLWSLQEKKLTTDKFEWEKLMTELYKPLRAQTESYSQATLDSLQS